MSGVAMMNRMDEWPAWQRWGAWIAGLCLYALAFWLLITTDDIALRVVALIVMGAGMVVASYASRAVLNERMRHIDRGYLRLALPAFLVYVVLVMYVAPRASQIGTPWLKVVAVLSPMLPILFVAWAMVRYINRGDEMERRQHLEAAGVAMLVVSLVAMALGFLAAAKLIVVPGTVALLMVLPALCIVYGMTCGWLKWRNRAR